MRHLWKRWITVVVALVAALVTVAPAVAIAFVPRPVVTSALAEKPACAAENQDDEKKPADRPVAPNLDEEEDDDDLDDVLVSAGVEPQELGTVVPAGYVHAPLERPTSGHWTDLDTTLRPPRA